MESIPSYGAAPLHNHRPDLPLYRSHKLVRAARIHSIHPASGVGNHTLVLALPQPGALVSTNVTNDWLEKRVPEGKQAIGGYYVVYDDGYDSWSPANKFEEGNSLLTAADLAQLAQQHVDGTHPEGHLNGHDEGALMLAVSTVDAPEDAAYEKVVRVDFGKPTAWLGMSPQQAVEFAAMVIKQARKCGAVVTLHL